MKQLVYVLIVTLSMMVQAMSLDDAATEAHGSVQSESSTSLVARELVARPGDLISRCDEIRLRLDARINQKGIDQKTVTPAIIEQIEEFERECPIVLLGECRGNCPLNRSTNPRFRESFEREASARLLAKATSGKPVYYTDFGSGSLFQLLVVVAKVLDKQPAAALDLHAIDHSHDSFSFYRDNIGRDRRFTAQDQRLVTEPFSNELIEKIRYRRGQDAFDNNAVERSFKTHYAQSALKSSQMVNLLEQAFPLANVSLTLHGCVQDYFRYIRSRVLPYPDLITAVDIQDSYSERYGAYQDYMDLCIETLIKNPSADNIWLRIDAQPNRASLVTIRAKQEQSNNLSRMTFYQIPEPINNQGN